MYKSTINIWMCPQQMPLPLLRLLPLLSMLLMSLSLRLY